MQLYSENENYKLYLGDVLEVLKQLPSESVDMIFTSPPYNIGLKDRKDTNIATYDNWDDNLEYKEYFEWQVKILDECYRIVKDGGFYFIIIKINLKMKNIKTLLKYYLKQSGKLNKI